MRVVLLCRTGLLVKGDVDDHEADMLDGRGEGWLTVTDFAAYNPAGGSTTGPTIRVAIDHVVTYREDPER